jgi:hypothetical protein
VMVMDAGCYGFYGCPLCFASSVPVPPRLAGRRNVMVKE